MCRIIGKANIWAISTVISKGTQKSPLYSFWHKDLGAQSLGHQHRMCFRGWYKIALPKQQGYFEVT